MAMDTGGSSDGPKSQINVTPLVDVMLVLLIIMMLVAPMLQRGVDVKLPLAANTSEEKTERVVLIKGDTDASYRAIMAAMDDLRKAGIEDIGLITDPKVDPNNPQQPPVGGK